MSGDPTVPYVIDVNMTDVLNSDTLKIFSILIEPKIHKTVQNVLEKLKGLFNLNDNIQFVNKLSHIPELETSHILYYLKGVRVINKNSELFPISDVTATDEVVGSKENIKNLNTSRAMKHKNGIPKKQDLGVRETSNPPSCPAPRFEEDQGGIAEFKSQRTWTRSFSLGDFMADLRNGHEEPIDSSIVSFEADDTGKRRKRSRRRKKRESIPDDNEQDAPTPKYSKPYSFETASHHEAKHFRFTNDDVEISSDKESMQEAVKIAEPGLDPDPAEGEINDEPEAQLAALFSLKADVGGPVIFMRTPPAIH